MFSNKKYGNKYVQNISLAPTPDPKYVCTWRSLMLFKSEITQLDNQTMMDRIDKNRLNMGHDWNCVNGWNCNMYINEDEWHECKYLDGQS